MYAVSTEAAALDDELGVRLGRNRAIPVSKREDGDEEEEDGEEEEEEMDELAPLPSQQAIKKKSGCKKRKQTETNGT